MAHHHQRSPEPDQGSAGQIIDNTILVERIDAICERIENIFAVLRSQDLEAAKSIPGALNLVNDRIGRFLYIIRKCDLQLAFLQQSLVRAADLTQLLPCTNPVLAASSDSSSDTTASSTKARSSALSSSSSSSSGAATEFAIAAALDRLLRARALAQRHALVSNVLTTPIDMAPSRDPSAQLDLSRNSSSTSSSTTMT